MSSPPAQTSEVPAQDAPAASAAAVSSPAPAPATSAPTSEAAPNGTAAAAAPAAAPSTTSAPSQTSTPAPSAGAATTNSSNSGTQPNTSLYVGELDLTVTEAMLFEIFSMIGAVASIRVCRDAVTRRSLGYAYVNYLNASDAERALEQLNYSLIKNKACRIMWSQRDPSLRKTGQGNIFIKNLDETIDNKALHDTFAAFGDILSCKVALDENGMSKGYGFVHYVTAEAAQAAIANVNGMQLNDKVVFVGLHIPRRERQAKIDEVRSNYTNLYVKNLPLEVTTEELNEMFGKYGPITSASVTTDVEGASKGFGFVNFDSHEAAAAAVEDLHDKDYKGNVLYVARAQKRSERDEELRRAHEQQKYETTLKYQGVNLYVKNLDDEFDSTKLEAEFAPFGTITSCKVMIDDKGVSRGFGFVCFSAPDEATKAVAEMNGKMLGNKPLYVSLAQRKDVRKQQLEAQMTQRAQMRNQQLAAAGIPGAPYGMPPNQMGYPGAYPGYGPQGRGMMYPQGMPGMPPRPRYAPPGQMPPMGMPGPYGQPPQGYPGYPTGPMGPQGGMRGPGGPAGRGGPMPPQMNGRGPMPPQGPGGPMRGPGGPGGMPPRAGPGGYPQGPMQQGNGPRPGPPQARAPEPAAAPSGINPAALAKASPTEQKQMLGEALYPMIADKQPEKAGKITGMILEVPTVELLHLLEDRAALDSKIDEALEVLDDYYRQGGA